MWNSASATPPLHSTRLFNKLNNYVKELYYLLPNGTNIEGRFKITYAPGKLTREEITGVGFDYIDIQKAMNTYKPQTLKDGLNIINGEEIYFIPSPSLGLWSAREKFLNSLHTNLTFAKRMNSREPGEPVWQQLIQSDEEDIEKYKLK